MTRRAWPIAPKLRIAPAQRPRELPAGLPAHGHVVANAAPIADAEDTTRHAKGHAPRVAVRANSTAIGARARNTAAASWPSPRAASPNASATCRPSPASISTSRAGRSTASSGRTAPANPPPSACCAVCCTPTAASVDACSGCELPRDAEAVKRRIGYMTQKFSLYEDLTVRENLTFLAEVHGLGSRVTRGAHRRTCASATGSTNSSSGQAGTLSGGQKQRLALAGAVLHEPELLLLDEPTSAVDPQSRREFWDSLFDLADAGTTLLVSTHYMDEAERCHRLAILEQGHLVADGSPGGIDGGPAGPRAARGVRRTCAPPTQQVLSRKRRAWWVPRKSVRHCG
jgi:ABC-type Na+ transport system ATPase subunit NatA